MRAGPASTSTAGAGATQAVAAFVQGWPQASREASAKMVSQYGEPDGRTARMLVWHDAGPWKTIVLSRDTVLHRFPMAHPDLLEQVIDYRVPPAKFDELAEFDGSVIVERTKGTMSARCDQEPMNILALNLAHDIVTDKKTVQEARQFYAMTAKALMQGERHPYTQTLQFTVQANNTADPDQPAGAM